LFLLHSTATAQPEPARPFLADHRIVSLYGNPLAPGLGALGQQPPEQTVARARAQADAYAPLSPDRTVQPALHLIYAIAQAAPGADGLYLSRMSDELVQQYIDLTRDNGLLLFLDIQMGRSTIEREVSGVAGFLANPHVHLALDPEFAWGPGVTPVEDIGFLTAAQIDQAQMMLAQVAIDAGLPDKILIVHQFRTGMIRDKAAISTVEKVELVIDMDGFGPPASKLATYDAVITNAENVHYAGVKLFYEHDQPLLSPEDVMALEPQPVVVIYQ
jgi:hypothetical protein